MQVQVIINSACGLKNVNWRYGMLHPYAVVWIDTSRKYSTKVDMNNGMNPVWGEKFTIALPPTSFMETAILCIDIVHANALAGTKPLVGSARFQLSAVLNEARALGKVPLCLNLLRPSRRPQGSVEINIGVKDSNIGQINQYNPQQTPYKQHVAVQPQPQVHMAQFQPRPQVQPQGQFQPRPQVIPQVIPPGQFKPQLQVTPQDQCQPQPQVLPQGQFQPKQQVTPQGQFQPKKQVKPQGQFQARPQVIPQGQFKPQPQVLPQGQFQPQPQVLPQGQYQPQPQVLPQGQYQPLPVVQPQGQYQQQPQVLSQGQSQPRPRSQKNPKIPPQVQPVVNPPNSNGSVRPTPVQGPKNRPVRRVQPTSAQGPQNRPAYQQINPGPVRQQYNPAFGMGPRANVAMQNRDMLIAQNQIGQFMNNLNSNAASGAAGANDNGETKSAPGDNGETKIAPGDNGETNSANGADNTVDNSKAEHVEETHSSETFNDAESMHLSYNETPSEPVSSDNGGHDSGEYPTEEYDNGGNNANAGVVEDATHEEYSHEGYDKNAGVVEDATHEENGHGGYDANAGVEYANEEYGHGGYDANAGGEYATHEEYGHEGYDANAGVGEYANEEYGHEGYDENAGVEYGHEGYDINAGTECDYGVYENGHDYANEHCDGAFDGAGLDSHVDCGEVEVPCESILRIGIKLRD